MFCASKRKAGANELGISHTCAYVCRNDYFELVDELINSIHHRWPEALIQFGE